MVGGCHFTHNRIQSAFCDILKVVKVNHIRITHNNKGEDGLIVRTNKQILAPPPEPESDSLISSSKLLEIDF